MEFDFLKPYKKHHDFSAQKMIVNNIIENGYISYHGNCRDFINNDLQWYLIYDKMICNGILSLYKGTVPNLDEIRFQLNLQNFEVFKELYRKIDQRVKPHKIFKIGDDDVFKKYPFKRLY